MLNSNTLESFSTARSQAEMTSSLQMRGAPRVALSEVINGIGC